MTVFLGEHFAGRSKFPAAADGVMLFPILCFDLLRKRKETKTVDRTLGRKEAGLEGILLTVKIGMHCTVCMFLMALDAT